MKKNLLYIILVSLFLTSLLTIGIVKVSANASGTGGSSGGNVHGSCKNTFCSGFEINYESGQYGSAYIVQLVYYNGSTWDILSEGIMYNGSNSTVLKKINSRNQTYINTPTATEFANKLHTVVYERRTDDDFITNWFNANGSANFKQLASDMGVPTSKLGKPSTLVRAYTSKGYRFIVQKLVAFDGGFQSRKELASSYNYSVGGSCIFGIWHVTTGSCVGSFYDLNTFVDDIGIRAPGMTTIRISGITRNTRFTYDRLKLKIENSNEPNGAGYGIYEFENPYSNPDYSIDAACEDCKQNNQNGSYFIQDTTNWESILASKTSNIKNAKTYYIKKIGSCEVYCREEYRITYPNANDKISVESGRFFTVNKLGGSMYATGIPNFKQIKVTKVRECRVKDGDQRSCLASFANSAKSSTTKTDKTGSAAGDVGTLKLTYKENYKDSKYNKDEYKNIELKENKDRTIIKDEYINSTVDNSNVMLKSTVTKYFELPENTFRWINIRDGVSSFKKPTEGLDHYLDVETSNLPVSINNKTKDKGQTAGTVTLNYSLPSNTDDPYTLIKKAFNTKNDYFLDPESKPSDNLYSQAKKGELDDNGKQQIQQSACAKLFGFGTSKYNTCVNERTSNKAGSCYTQIVKPDKYVCDIGLCPEEGCDIKCQFINNTYYDKNGNITDKAGYEKDCPACKIQNGKYYGQNGKEVTKEEYLVECPQICRIENGKYYGKKGQLVSKSQYEKECPDQCLLCNGGKCCPDLDMVCPDMNGECPGKGNKIIYRPIDLQNPFPGQTNYQRATGSNWCAYNVKTGKLNCKSTNGVATTHIQNNRSTDDENVYNLTPLYEVNLDPTIMKSIRKYNKTHEYDDFTLDCTNGKTCYSTFLRESGNGLKITGACANKANATTCAESRG